MAFFVANWALLSVHVCDTYEPLVYLKCLKCGYLQYIQHKWFLPMYNKTSRGIDRYPPTSESAESKDKIVVATNILLVYSRVVDQGKRTCSRFQHKTNTYCGWLRNPAPPKGWLNPKQNSGMNHLLTGEDRISLAHQQYLSTVPLVTVTNCRPKRIHHHIHGCPPDRVDRFLHIPEPHTSLTMSYPSPQE